MTLTTHAVVGAAAASLFPQEPAVAFVAGFASHLLIDAIPHWDYKLASIKEDQVNALNTYIDTGRSFWPEVALVACDALLGFAVSAILFSTLVFHAPLWLPLLGAFAALVPDGLHFIYFMWHPKIMEFFERFHIWVNWKNLYVPAWEGIGLQAAMVAGILGVLKVFGLA